MKHSLVCVFAIAWWYLLYPSARHKGGPDFQSSLSSWVIAGSYGAAADCDAAHRDDLNAILGLAENSHDAEDGREAFLQTQAGRCIASDDPRVAR
jgi:hypothetical protein